MFLKRLLCPGVAFGRLPDCNDTHLIDGLIHKRSQFSALLKVELAGQSFPGECGLEGCILFLLLSSLALPFSLLPGCHEVRKIPPSDPSAMMVLPWSQQTTD